MNNDGKHSRNKESDNQQNKNPELDYYVWVEKVIDILKEKPLKKHVIDGMWTPSGFFHIGNSRAELLIPAFVAKRLKEEGINAEHNFIIDDFDDFDKIPAGIDVDEKEFEQYLGKPLKDVPSPVKGFKSWVDYFADGVVPLVKEFGAEPVIRSSYSAYKEGLYDDAIRAVLDKAEEVRKLWKEITKSDKPKGWLPVMTVCENCGRSSTTKVTSWDGEYVQYICNQDRDYANACKHEGKVKPAKGRAKLPWRLHWPATWKIYGTTFETGGKDHFAAGSSVDTGRAFCRHIFNCEPPFQTPAEFLVVDGKKLSGSSGNVISLRDWLDFAEPELLRFMMISYKPQTVINFDLHSNKFFLLADRYEEAERAYFEKKDEKETALEKRDRQLIELYKFSQIKEITDKMPMQLDYSNAVIAMQTFPNMQIKELAEILHAKGWIRKKTLNAYDKERLVKRLQLAKNWLEKYAPEDVKFVVQEKVPEGLKLTQKEKEALHEVAKVLKDKEWEQQDLFNEFYNICQKAGVKNTDFFRAAYNVLLNKDRGPKLAPFILALGKEKVAGLFEDV
ncbi:MAG: lysine--tRNA ligase [Nanoarchaeota archaeon]